MLSYDSSPAMRTCFSDLAEVMCLGGVGWVGWREESLRLVLLLSGENIEQASPLSAVLLSAGFSYPRSNHDGPEADDRPPAMSSLRQNTCVTSSHHVGILTSHVITRRHRVSTGH